MASLTIRNVPDELLSLLRGEARRHHRSLSQHVLQPLSRTVESPAPPSILELRGLGKEVWEGIDAARYVQQERDSWDQG